MPTPKSTSCPLLVKFQSHKFDIQK